MYVKRMYIWIDTEVSHIIKLTFSRQLTWKESWLLHLFKTYKLASRILFKINHIYGKLTNKLTLWFTHGPTNQTTICVAPGASIMHNNCAHIFSIGIRLPWIPLLEKVTVVVFKWSAILPYERWGISCCFNQTDEGIGGIDLAPTITVKMNMLINLYISAGKRGIITVRIRRWCHLFCETLIALGYNLSQQAPIWLSVQHNHFQLIYSNCVQLCIKVTNNP